MSCVDYICVRFLKSFKWLILILMGVAFIHTVRNPPTTSPRTKKFVSHSGSGSSSSSNIRSSSSTSLKSKSETEKFAFPNGPPDLSSDEEDEDEEEEIEPRDMDDSENSADDDPSNDEGKDVVESFSKSEDSPRSPRTISKDGDPSASLPKSQSAKRPQSPKDRQRILQSYQPLFSPVLEYHTNAGGDGGNKDDMGWKKAAKVQVHLIVDVTTSSNGVETSAEITASPASKSMLEAIERSEHLQLTAVTFIQPNDGVGTIPIHPRRSRKDRTRSQKETPLTPLLYIVDFGSMDRDCHRLELVLEKVQEQMSIQTPNEHKQDEENEEEPMYLLIDVTGSTRQTKCDFLIQQHSPPRVRLAKRSIVENRYFNFTSGQIHTGQIIPNSWQEPHVGTGQLKPVLHSPFALREGFVSTIFNITQGKKVFDHKRTIDVGMFWKRGDYSHYGFLRRQTAEVVKTLHHSKAGENLVLENLVEIAYSDEKGMEVGNIQHEYAVQLLSCKIVVISQRDEYEDHWRLMESMASGAMVMTDVMLAPPLGLEDRVNVVVYKDPEELKDLIRYYKRHDDERKKIARKGYELAMGRHRCWHRMEELIFGTSLSHVDRPFDPAPPKEPRPQKIQWLFDDKERHSSTTPYIV